jgi:uncharacterized RDD family membrane protein YckC
MVDAMARSTGSWLNGPSLDGPSVGGADTHLDAAPGTRLGLPASGAGSVAGIGRRLGAIFVDWIVALLIAGAITGEQPLTPGHDPILTLGIFALEYVLLLTLLGYTIGMRLFRVRVISLDGPRISFPWVLVRTLLLVLVVPAVVYDRDYRGLHDRASNTVVVRS